MRKALLFLLLLGAGLFLLYTLDRLDSGDAPPPSTPDPEPDARPDPGTQGFQLGARTQLTRYDDETKRPILRLESADTRTEGGTDLLSGVSVELLDPHADGVVQMRLSAEQALLRRAESGDRLQPSWEERIELTGVRAELLSGTALAPLTFRTERATLDVAAGRTVQTDAPFTALGPELSLAGIGFSASLEESRLVLPREGKVEIRPGTPRGLALSSLGEGRLELRRQGPEGPVEVQAYDRARLTLGTDEPGLLEAQQILLVAGRAGAPSGEPGALRPERLEAEGDVEWTSGDARFEGQHLAAAFASDGQLEQARLTGEPRAELVLELSPGDLPVPDVPDQRLVNVEGPLAIEIRREAGGYALSLEAGTDPAAPAAAHVPVVTTRDFRLESASTIDGWLAADRRSARFEAHGGVIVTSGDATLETADFEVTIGPDERGETVLVGTASGGARLEGKLPQEAGASGPERVFTLTSPDGLSLERRASGWRVIESTRVAVGLTGPNGFQASAQRVYDFVVPSTRTGELAPEGLRFKAAGLVRAELENLSVGGEELEVMAIEPVPHLVLRGTSESKAFFSTELGGASALEIERTGETLHARGEVAGALKTGNGTEREVEYAFSGDELTLDRSESPELLPGERLRTLRFVVDGNFQGRVTAKDQTLVAKCRHFSGENRARLVEGAPAPQELGSLFIAEGAVHADLLQEGNQLTVDCDRLELERTASDVERGFRRFTADGAVHFEGKFGAQSGGAQEFDIEGDCELLVFDADRHGTLEAGPGGRVILNGREPGRDLPYRLAAERIDFDVAEEGAVRLLATRPELRMLGLRARAAHFSADDQRGVVLSGAVRVSGSTSSRIPYTLDAEEVRLTGRRPAEGEELEDQLDAMQATGAIDFRLADGLRARGERLIVRRASGLLRLEGVPAYLEMGATRLEAEWADFDPNQQILVSTGRGRMLSQEGGEPRDSWVLDFLSASTRLDLDSVVLVIQEPFFRTAQFQSALRASWAILWLNREAFQDTARREELLDAFRKTLRNLEVLPEKATPAEKLALFRSAELAGFLREIYFEGPVEVLAEGELLARADAIYLDVASQHGWLAGATVHLGDQFLGQRQEKLIIKADWLRLSSDASLRADQATVTSCTYEEPHVRVVTGDLRIEPTRGKDEAHYRLVLEDNRIELYDLLKIPLPTIDVAADEEFEPLWPTLSLANSARFGTLLGFAFRRPADKAGELFDKLARPDQEQRVDPAQLAKPRSDVDAHYNVDASYLGSRGGLLDLGLEIEVKEDYWFDIYLGTALDSGEDRGFIRVDEADRSNLRTWLRSEAYFDHGRSSWSFSYNNQSDAGVQSEFYEGDFLRYERAESYVQWRRSAGENFLQGSAKLRTDDFRNDIEELPSFSGYRGRSPLYRLGSLSLIHTGDARAEYLRRLEGSGPRSPFEPLASFGDDVGPGGVLDGLGEREVARVDTNQALEVPVPLGSGVKLTPFVVARASAWSEGVEEEDQPTRIVAEAGARLGGTLWTRTQKGKLHQIAPFVEFRSELEREDEDGVPVSFDSVDHLLTGDLVRFGSRSRFASTGEDSLLDLDLIGAYAASRSDGAPDGWLPFEAFARLLLDLSGREVEVFYDARYDFELQQTPYSVVSFGTHLGQEWGLQLSHQRGRDTDGEALFEAASVIGLYRWTEKWEFEGRESFSLLEDHELDTRFGVRRYGHDLVLEIESSFREGEGSSFGISVKPRFGFRPPRVGYVPW